MALKLLASLWLIVEKLFEKYADLSYNTKIKPWNWRIALNNKIFKSKFHLNIYKVATISAYPTYYPQVSTGYPLYTTGKPIFTTQWPVTSNRYSTSTEWWWIGKH